MVSTEEAEFMEVIKNYRCLYDKSCKDFKNRETKRAAWGEVGRLSGVENPENLYKTIRDRFTTRYLRGLKVPSGSRSIKLSPGYESLRWLTGFIKHRRTISNDDTQDSQRLDSQPEEFNLLELESQEQDEEPQSAIEMLMQIEAEVEDPVLNREDDSIQVVDTQTASLPDTSVPKKNIRMPEVKRQVTIQNQPKKLNKKQKVTGSQSDEDGELFRTSIHKLSKEPVQEDECSYFGHVMAEKLRSLPRNKRSLAQLRLMQAMVEVEDELL